MVIEETPYGGLVAHKAFRGSKVSPHALIDVGSNTFHLLVGEVENGMVLAVAREKISARLGSGVERPGGSRRTRSLWPPRP